LVCVFMTEEEVNDYDSAVKSDTGLFGRYFNHLLNNGIYIAPSQFEAMFVSNAHTDKDIDETLEKVSLFFCPQVTPGISRRVNTVQSLAVLHWQVYKLAFQYFQINFKYILNIIQSIYIGIIKNFFSIY